MDKKLPKKYIELLFIIGMGLALIIAAVTASLAWFTSQNNARSENTLITSQDSDRLDVIIPEVSADYNKYMGQTGIQYNGEDFPYFLEYTPVIINWNFYNPGSSNYYLRTSFSDSSYIEFVFASQDDELLTAEKLENNFTTRFHLLTYNEQTEAYEETGSIYRPDNGYLRNVESGELLQLGNSTQTVFKMFLYFQGEYAYNLLMESKAGISQEYTFEFSDEMYMFATFNLFSLFEMKDLLVLHFNSTGYDASYTEMEAGYAGTSIEQMLFTGGSLLGANGTERNYPVPEIRKQGVTDYSLYFEDWFSWYQNPKTQAQEARIYRTEKAEGVYTLEETNLNSSSSMLNAKWGVSNTVTLDLNYTGALEQDELYLRPKSNYYSAGGYLEYDPVAQNLKVYNPSAGSGALLRQTIAVPVRTGYAFDGWALDADGIDTAFTQENGYKIPATTSGDITLYAKWFEKVDVTFNIHETWGSSYATVNSGTIKKGTLQYSLSGGSYKASAEKNTDLFDFVSDYTVTANVRRIAAGTDQALTLKGWKYEIESNVWVELTESTSFSMASNIQLYPIWNERATYSVTLDLYHSWGSVIKYNAVCGFNVNSPVATDRYNVLFDGSYMGEFYGSESSNTVISNIPEGVTFNSLNLSIAYSKDRSNNFLLNLAYKQLNTNSNDLSGTFNSYNPVKYNTALAITASMTLYAQMDN